MNVLITGTNGQLGSEIKEISSNYPSLHFIFSDRNELDICDLEALRLFIAKNQVNTVINCAAYTAVDQAENDSQTAEKINATAVQNLVLTIQEVEGKLIHISTDYVFDGNGHLPYKEEDVVNPNGIYGKTKLQGEQYILKSSIDAIVIRTSWLYSSFGHNFVKTMLKLGPERTSLNVIYDQIGTPTYAGDLAASCLDVLVNNDKVSSKGKLYHYSNEGVASWYDFALAIFDVANIDCMVNPIETFEYPTPATRPAYSILNKRKIKEDFDIQIPYWKTSLEKCINILNTKK